MQKLASAAEQEATLPEDTKKQYLDYVAGLTKPIDSASYFLFTLSRTYVDVSQQFMTTRLAGLGKMLTLTPAEQKAALAKLRLGNSVLSQLRNMNKLMGALIASFHHHVSSRLRRLV